MIDVLTLIKFITPKYLALIASSISFCSIIFIFLDWLVCKQYGLTLLDIFYSKLYHMSHLLGVFNPVSIANNYRINNFYHFTGFDGKVWKNSLSLFRACEYDLYEKETNLKSLTDYDKNFSSIDHQEFFTCSNDYFYPEFSLMAKAWRFKNQKLRIVIAYKALELNPNCSTALILLAEERANDFNVVEKILRLALKAAENRYNKSKILIDSFDSKDESSNNDFNQVSDSNKVFSQKSKLNSSNKKSSFKKSEFPNLNTQSNKFEFHKINKEVINLLKELQQDDGTEFDEVKKKMNFKPFSENNLDSDLNDLNEPYMDKVDDFFENYTTDVLGLKNCLFSEELIRDYKVILYVKRRLGMCLRKLGKLKEAVKLFNELNKEFPAINAFSCFENLVEIYLEMESYSDLQTLLARYDDINMPKSAALCYTSALMKIKCCAEKYLYIEEPSIQSSFLSYNYFNEVNYFDNPNVHFTNVFLNIPNQYLLNNLNGVSENNLNSNQTSLSQNTMNSTSGTNNLTCFTDNINSLSVNNLANVKVQLVKKELAALEAIYRAVEFNPHVPVYLLEYKSLTVPPEHILRRGDTEAVAYAFSFLKHWKNIPGALKMLEMTWKNAFKLFPDPTTKGRLFYPYPLFIMPVDRELMPEHFQITYYPSKDFSFTFLIVLSFLFFFIFVLIVSCREPDELQEFIVFMKSFFTALKQAALGGLSITMVFYHIVSVARVDGTSMQPCLNPEITDSKKRTILAQDYVLLNKIKTFNFKVQHGDIIAFRSPKNPNEILIKRVIALQNDVIKTIPIKYKSSEVLEIPKGQIWVEGDHLNKSMDSRHFGYIPSGLIVAKATHIVWPPSRWQSLENKSFNVFNHSKILNNQRNL